MSRFKTIHPSDLYVDIVKIYHKSDTYIKCKALFFYKSSNNICYWLNPNGRPKNYKLLKSVYDNYVDYIIKPDKE